MGWKRAGRELVVCLLAVTLWPGLPPASAGELSVAKLVRRAHKLADKGDFAGAWILAEQAVARQPHDPAVRALAEAYQRRGLQALSSGRSLRLPPGSVDLTDPDAPEPVLPEVTPQDRRELAPPPDLRPDRVVRSLDLRESPRALIEKVAAAYGITAVFDYDFPTTGPTQHLHLSDAGWCEAIYSLELVTDSFYVPVNARVALFAKETTVKRGEVEPNIAVSIPFPESMTAPELQEVANAVRMAFGLTKVAMDSNQHAMVLRDRVSRVRPAVEVARQLLSGPAEVYVDIELFSVNDSSTLNRGLSLQTSYPIVDFGRTGFTMTAPATPTGVSSLATFGGGSTFLGVGLSNASVLASLTGQMATSVARASIRSISGQPATIHIGDKYPIIQQSWGTGAGDTSGYATVPSITFEDLGIVVKLTPRVHDADSLTLDFDAEYEVLSGNTADSIPIISNRKFTVQVRMKFGESAVVAGLVQNSVTNTDSGLPLLNWIPLLHSQTVSRSGEQFLLVLRPTLMRLPPSEFPSFNVWSGTETRGLPFNVEDRAAENHTSGLP